MKNKPNKLILNILIFFTLLFVLLLKQSISSSKNFSLSNKVSLLGEVFAEDDEEDDEEDEEDEEDDEDDEDNYEDEIIYETVEIPVTPLIPEPRYITVVDQGYDTDTDKDELVDAIDPHPTIHEKELFTDDDDDGIPNATDKYKGEDDFLFIDFSDDNDNGILDAFEY